MSNAACEELTRLLSIMAALRDQVSGCAWDLEQSFATIAPYTIEEAYEVADAIEQNDMPGLQGELGDLLFQVVFHARLAEEAQAFDFAAVARAISDKMIHRHPHVFAAANTRSAADQVNAWEAQKAEERQAEGRTSALAGIATSLPALTRAVKLAARAARVGFDWPDLEPVFEKLQEEVQELQAELPEGDKVRLADELGDVLFVIANLARKLDLDPETCLRAANTKFQRRFEQVERRVDVNTASLDAMDQAWTEVKQDERRQNAISSTD